LQQHFTLQRANGQAQTDYIRLPTRIKPGLKRIGGIVATRRRVSRACFGRVCRAHGFGLNLVKLARLVLININIDKATVAGSYPAVIQGILRDAVYKAPYQLA
jgi:hypothetical protein